MATRKRLAWPCLAFALASTLPANAQPPAFDAAVMAALNACQGFSSGQVAHPTDPANIPPGMAVTGPISVAAIPGTGGKAFRYEGTLTRVLNCGIAVYGPVSEALNRDIRDRATRDTRRTFREGRCEGMAAICLWARPPSANAPTIEVQYYSVLMR